VDDVALELDVEELEALLVTLPELDDVVTLVSGIVVDNPLTTTCVTPLITVVLPDTEKLGFNGIVVKPPVSMSSVVPPITVKPAMVGAGVGASKVVAPETIK
jgi:hypothetical protein